MSASGHAAVRAALLGALCLVLGGSGCAGRRPPRTPPEAPLAASSHLQCQRLLDGGLLYAARLCCGELLAQAQPSARALALCGRVDAQLGHTEAAIDKLGQAVALDAAPENWELFLGLRRGRMAQSLAAALLREQHGDFAAAARLLEAAGAEPDAELLCRIGSLWLAAGLLDEAESAFTRLADAEAQPCSLRGLGRVALARGRPSEAAEISRRLVELGHEPLPGPRPDHRADRLDALESLESLTRADLALLLLRLLPEPDSRPDAPAILLDVAGHPLRDELREVVARGWMQPTAEGLMHPERPVSRLELARILASLPGEAAPPAEAAARAPRWAAAFPELAPLGQWQAYAELTEPRQLLEPISGAQAAEILRRRAAARPLPLSTGSGP
jgi:tetratricopeptide (TPR) repeat protein